MARTLRSHLTTRSRSRSATKLTPVLLLLLALLPMLPGPTSAQSTSLFLHASLVASPAGSIFVHGDGFTPGGLVYIAVSDSLNVEVSSGMWTRAAATAYGPNGSADPAWAGMRMGSIREVISLEQDEVYGPHGSQDPAQGYVAETDGAALLAALCTNGLDVAAYDHTLGTWSDRVEIAASGASCAALPDPGPEIDPIAMPPACETPTCDEPY
jgi:hypothetical protein